MIKKGIIFILLLLMVLGVVYRSLIGYLINQGVAQLKIIWNARPIQEVLLDQGVSESVKMKLRYIEEVRQFATDSLGLRNTENYKTLYDQQGKEIMWVVQACEPFELKAKTWHFPIVGDVPYKGYFDQQKALELKRELEENNYDVKVSNPSGWSTLGWFKDPILSDMLDNSMGGLANLIIHELVHATIFVKNNADFNENLANFIADVSTYQFLTYRFGKESKEYREYWSHNQDSRKFVAHILQGAKALDSLYNSMKQQPVERKKELKQNMIHAIVMSLDTLKLYGKKSNQLQKHPPNNTFFMSFRLYESKQDLFKEELNTKFNGDLREYIKYLTDKYPIAGKN